MEGDFTGTPSGIKCPFYVVLNQQSMHGKGAVAGGHTYRRQEAVMRQEQAGTPFRDEHGFLSDDTQPESIHPRIDLGFVEQVAETSEGFEWFREHY